MVLVHAVHTVTYLLACILFEQSSAEVGPPTLGLVSQTAVIEPPLYQLGSKTQVHNYVLFVLTETNRAVIHLDRRAMTFIQISSQTNYL